MSPAVHEELAHHVERRLDGCPVLLAGAVAALDLSQHDVDAVLSRVEEPPPPDPIRARAVELIHKLGDDIAGGRLRGGRIQWREGLVEAVRVELDADGSEARLETIDLRTGATRPLQE